jgi:predicted acylesterase/phospholipase RssA
MADRFDETYPAALREPEKEAIQRRRRAEDRAAPVVGLALSGGGIRSATFSLGVLQALAKEGLLSRIDYLSTVSGGGYVGGFLGGLFLPGRWADVVAADPKTDASPARRDGGGADARNLVRAVEAILTDPQSKPVFWLRESGRYLSPNGAGDALTSLAAFLRNWLAIHVVIATLLLVPVAALRVASHGASAAVDLLPTALRDLLPERSLSLLPVLTLLFWSVPAAGAYWWSPWLSALLLIVVAAMVPVVFAVPLSGTWLAAAAVAVTLALVLATGAYFHARYRDVLARRRNLTDGFKLSLVTAFGLSAVALVDALGSGIYRSVVDGHFFWGSLVAAPLVAIPFTLAQRYAPRLLAVARPRLRLSPALIASTVGIAVFALGLSVLSACIQPLTWKGAAAVAAGAFVASLFLGRTLEFLNLSSHSTLYTARLTRAYLGASNPDRHKYSKSLVDPIRGDEIEMRAYRPHEHGGPLHLINATLNETLGGETQVEYRDRKGLNLAVGPCAISVGARHHALADWASTTAPHGVSLTTISPAEGYRVFAPPQTSASALTLGRWLAVSGAAFTTGLGSRTSLGLSLVLGLSNIRLGYWWASGCDPGQRTNVTHVASLESLWRGFSWLLPVQAHLVDEFLARFYGPARRLWYLSDGGHFENTAVYELIRRRVPFIVACDNGADPDYSCQDLGDLVRKARTDFNAEIRFLEAEELDERIADALKGLVAPWRELRRYERPGSPGPQGTRDSETRPYASLAEVSYLDSSEKTTVLFIKPNLRGDESADVLTYWSKHRDFPQETTLDQYFDEAQWESYRRLGEHIGSRLLRRYPGPGWTPGSLSPLPPRT